MTISVNSRIELLPIPQLRESLLAGERVGKDLIIRSCTAALLGQLALQRLSRSELTRAVFRHTRMWLTFAGNLTGRRFRYVSITTEQVALILIHRHQATSAPADAVPSDWVYEPVPGKPRSQSPVIAIWADRELGSRLHIDEGFTPNFITWPLLIQAAAHQYKPEMTIADGNRMTRLLHSWAPQASERRSATATEPADQRRCNA